ncbi:hypothetical protein BATDEDRAFT_88871 [Batrachochytrium dendrobatidis JAM81]|uniref:C-CAP/cofactor C-like domain-containing protein n=2 Tax=Batrachochytrium dendrobatidis TaxID=109871 RepID=F4P2S0_BATDJ|nr:uncharacterized protein BATDEDRAFT_88871 [Batrachochytrium dendrobatidis JAM81]EGF80070.1 hypothetical protein BATDEDRAFT_88871 [Batrachochytrium dendrobatidis JAM81]OAJ41391.1 hypothetical protein BDEG_25002 [Batrachochytrium dendrobatidis JEL423]|eukprot:XP_006679155.1 hypothetical protein BATDEDRAFT_88871 [Batrachochytrium dendrobatidis JAM81]
MVNQQQTAIKTENVQQAAQEFWLQFQQWKQDVQESLSQCPSGLSDELVAVKSEIAILSKRVTDATLFLPLYDQRQCSLQLKDLNDQVTRIQGTRAKFSFKSSKSKPSTNTKLTVSEHVVSDTASTLPLHGQVYSNINGKTCVAQTLPTSEQDLYVSNIVSSVLDLRCISAGAVHLKNITNSIVLFGPIRGSILVEQCIQSTVAVVCRQCRIHDSHRSIFHLHVASHPIIEDCDEIGFTSFEPLLLTNFDESLKTVGLVATRNEFNKVEDFNWLRQQASPNWRLIDEPNVFKTWTDVSNDETGDLTKSLLMKFTPQY